MYVNVGILVFIRVSPPFSHLPVSLVRSPAGCETVGRRRAASGGRAPEAQIWRLLRGIFSQQQIHRQRGKPARHDGQRLGVEGSCHFRALQGNKGNAVHTSAPVLWEAGQKSYCPELKNV